MTLKHINITEINLKLNMQDKNVGFYLDFSIEYVSAYNDMCKRLRRYV